MVRMNKINNGILYSEEFIGQNSMWHVDPITSNNKIKVNPHNFQLYPGEEILRYLTETPAKEFVMQVHIKHNPKTYNSVAGITILCDNNSYIELQSYRDQATESGLFVNYYSYMKIIKKDFRYTFYASIKGEKWDLIGSSLSRGSLIGFFYKCTDNTEVPLIIDDILFTSSNYITIYGLKGHYTVYMYKNNEIIFEKEIEQDASQINIDTINYVLPLKDIRILITDIKDNIVYDNIIDELYGGDTFTIDASKVLCYLDKENNNTGLLIDNMNELDLGRISNIDTSHYVIVESSYGEYGQPIYNTKIYIKPLLYNTHVTDYVYIALASDIEQNVESIDDSQWKKEIIIPEIDYNKPAKIFIKLIKDTTDIMLFDITKYKFKLVVE